MLLADLGPGESLRLYDCGDLGEDADVRHADGRRTVHQIKSGESSGSAGIAADVCAAAKKSLSSGEVDEFVFVTQERLTSTAAMRVGAMRSQWQGRFSHRRIPHPEVARRRVMEAVRRRFVYDDGVDLGDSLTIGVLDGLVAKFVDLAVALAGSGQGSEVWIDYDQIESTTRVGQAVQEWRATAVDPGLRPWASWSAAARDARGGYERVWAEAIDAEWAVRTVGEEKVLQAAEAWLDGDRRGHVIVVEGRSGSGKTWTLARLANALVERADLWFLESRGASAPDLRRLVAARPDSPHIVVVDDLREEQLDVTLAKALGVRNLLIVGGAGLVQTRHGDVSLPRDVQALLDIMGADDRAAVVEIRLAPVAEREDCRRLAVRLGWHEASIARDHIEVTWRHAVADAVPNAARATPAKLLAALGEAEPWTLPLMWASGVPLRVPRHLLNKRAGGTMPARLDHLVLERPTADNGATQWLEEDIVRAAWEQRPDDPRAERGARLQGLSELVALTDPARSDDRRFTRQLLRRLPWRDARDVARPHRDRLVEMAREDNPEEVAYTWLSIFERLGDTAAMVEIADIARIPPRTAADALVLATLFGADAAAQKLVAAIPATWQTGPWEDLFDAFGGLTGRAARQAARLLLHAARAHQLDITQLLRSGRAGPAFAHAVAVGGSEEQRDVCATAAVEVMAADAPPLALVGPAYELAERSVMGPRSLFALGCVRDAVGEPAPDDGCVALAKRELEWLLLREATHFPVSSVLDATTSLARRFTAEGQLTRAGHVWREHCRFARLWAQHDKGDYSEALELATALESQGVAASLVADLFSATARGIVERLRVAEPGVRVSAAPLDLLLARYSRPRGLREAGGFLVVLGALVKAEDDRVALAAAWLMLRLAEQDRDKILRSAQQLERSVRGWAGADRRLFTPAALVNLGRQSPDELVLQFLHNCHATMWCERAHPVGARAIEQLVSGRAPIVHAAAFSALYRQNRPELVAAMERELRAAGHRLDRPEPLARRAAFEARFGELAESRKLLAAMCDLEQRGQGVHLHTAHRALSALASREHGTRRALLSLARKAVLRGALTAKDDVWDDPEAEE